MKYRGRGWSQRRLPYRRRARQSWRVRTGWYWRRNLALLRAEERASLAALLPGPVVPTDRIWSQVIAPVRAFDPAERLL